MSGTRKIALTVVAWVAVITAAHMATNVDCISVGNAIAPILHPMCLLVDGRASNAQPGQSGR